MTDRHTFLVAVLFYGISLIYSGFLFRRGFREDNRINYCVLLGGFALHTLALWARGQLTGQCPSKNLYEATVFSSWVVAAVCLAVSLWPRLRFMTVFASPILFAMGVFALMPSLDVPPGHVEPKDLVATSLHAALVLLSYGAFGFATVVSMMFLVQEHDLKLRKARALFAILPPIQRLETIITELTVVGFFLLTVGLAVGAIGIQPAPGAQFKGDLKIIWSVFVWVVYLALLILHWRFAQRGRRFAWGVAGTFIFVMLTFWGANLASRIHNPNP
ncbi:MAG: cytochrome c biogenesis protein CcsA [Verrucomicrobiota bacterium]